LGSLKYLVRPFFFFLGFWTNLVGEYLYIGFDHFKCGISKKQKQKQKQAKKVDQQGH